MKKIFLILFLLTAINIVSSQVGECGDGSVGGDELCDAGENNGVLCIPDYYSACEYCTTECLLDTVDVPSCGDNMVQPEFGEECDDGNNVLADGCTNSCKIENEVPEFNPIGLHQCETDTTI